MDMNDDERGMLAESAARYLDNEYGFEARMRALAAPGEGLAQRWAAWAGMGWLGVGLPEAVGGLGGAREQLVLAEAFGRALCVEPWLANCGLAAPLLQALGGAQSEGLLAALAAGETRYAVAAWERAGRYDARYIETQARPDGEGWRLDGRKTLVLGAGAADIVLVAARTAGASDATDGIAVFAMPREQPGLACMALPTYDGRDTADLVLADVRLPREALLGTQDNGAAALARAVDHATVMLCGEAVGAMALAYEATLAYARERRQFGRALTANQVVRHRLVDMYVALEQSRAITEAAAARLDDVPAERARAVSLAKAFISPAGRRIGEEAVQLHGAIGMTDEYVVGHAYKRLAATANLFGDEAWHLERLAA
ncbi:acyl-CoA dehydrogenase [Verticiella sediminum]|uniref:Acyl-CoA dehydrogenase n=1 Tax=Verticiella sediminum TaxID=1247510 RepID=A0A556AGT1_9BURK|nr:acyl-CoA dehydrogenase [Verticiella sediminum]TSH92106.1 acyl-CoA dehydrogenase [Verticiella sediminum]